MPRSLKAILACAFLVSFLAIGFGAPPVQAYTTYTLYADSNIPSRLTDFSLQFTDSTVVDGKFEISELVPGSFHGVTYTTYEGVATRVDVLVGVTSDSQNVDWSEWIVEAPVGTSGGYWDFRQSTSTYYLGAPLSQWTYTREQAAVPIPPSVFLLGAGLIGLAVARRKKLWGK